VLERIAGRIAEMAGPATISAGETI